MDAPPESPRDATAPLPEPTPPPSSEPGASAHPPPKEAEATLLRSFSDRAWGVLLAPFQTFRHHDPAWGWGQAWGLVAVAGILVGVLALVRVDHDKVGAWVWERTKANMSATQLKQMENPDVEEATAKMRRVQAFGTKLSSVLGPPLLGLMGLVFGAGFLYLVAQVLGKEPPDPVRCLSVAAFLSLANLIDLCGSSVGVLLSNGLPRPDLSALADPFTQPLLAAALGRLSPGLIAYYVLLTAALEGSLGLTRKRALAVAGGTFLVVSLLLIALGGLGKLQMEAGS